MNRSPHKIEWQNAFYNEGVFFLRCRREGHNFEARTGSYEIFKKSEIFRIFCIV
jgi:hypothetical protein